MLLSYPSLEYIIGKLRMRMAAKARTFLIKVKAYRGEPLNERVDDPVVAEVGEPWTKRGRTTSGKAERRAW